MKWTQHLYSAVQFFQVLLLVLGGVFCLVLPLAPRLRILIAHSFLFNDALFFSLGVIVLSIGLILGFGFYFLQKNRVLQIAMDPTVAVDSEVVRMLVQKYLQKRFPAQQISTQVIIAPDESIEIVTENFPVHEEGFEKHLHEIEAEISGLLNQVVGYKKEFLMTFKFM